LTPEEQLALELKKQFQNLDPQAIVKGLGKRGYTIGGGYGDWKPTTFRIGHMGEVKESDLEALLAETDQVLEEVMASTAVL